MKIHKEDSISPHCFGDLPQEVQTICTSFLGRLKAILGENLHGVYLHGAVVFPESRYIQDIDFHVTVKRPLTGHEKEEILYLHKALAQEFPPLGVEVDVYYILLDDAQQVSPPRHQVYPDLFDGHWALHRAHMRAGYCIILHGPEPGQVFPAPTWLELVAGLEASRKNTEKHLRRYPDYCILNFCRLLYSYSTKDVVISKRAAAEWVINQFTTWGHLVEAALRVYEREGEEGDRRVLESEIERFYQFVCDKIEKSSADYTSNTSMP